MKSLFSRALFEWFHTLGTCDMCSMVDFVDSLLDCDFILMWFFRRTVCIILEFIICQKNILANSKLFPLSWAVDAYFLYSSPF